MENSVEKALEIDSKGLTKLHAILYVVFKGSWDIEKHRRSSPFLFGSFSFVDGGGIVDNFADFASHVAP